MRKIIPALVVAATMTVAISLTSCSSDKTVDDSIRFAQDGNIYMSQELCDAEDPDVSAEMEQKLKDWWNDVLSGKIEGEVICTD